MEYQMKSFEDYGDLLKFLNTNKISKGNIVSVSPTTTYNHHYDNKVVLIWYGFELN